ncbi:hypothetical protein ACFW1J_00140 [Priestia aryabhattai]|uniref:hypothetical protein n=1 Tax=Priestia aryabhattai TaxID=412384 RepID=UPI0008DC8F68|nr:hypothetical protein [Priestia aryabhattai]MBX9966166.1 hypothetical protein [Priestia aryabhattai]OHY76884.1 hypothetical protein BCV52_19640 [Priestia aryabhattai]
MKYKSNKSILKMSAIILLTIDLFFYLLALRSLYVFSSRVSIYFLIFVLHFIYLYIVLITVSKTKESKVFWGVIGPFFIVPIAIVGWFIFFYNNKVDYYYLSSPNSTQKLIIAYSNWSLGETNHYYDFYRQTGFPLVKKRLNHEALHVMTRNTDMSDLNVLGAHDAQWVNEQTVTFTSPYLNKEVTLNLK